jgi:DNA invertase Pin-like site-specific DNA recombinase
LGLETLVAILQSGNASDAGPEFGVPCAAISARLPVTTVIDMQARESGSKSRCLAIRQTLASNPSDCNSRARTVSRRFCYAERWGKLAPAVSKTALFETVEAAYNPLMTRVAVYARVSTADKAKGQDPENQLRKLRQFCKTQGWKIAEEYVDRASGAKSDRREFSRMFLDASRAQFDIVLFWSLDRFSREGIVKTLQQLNELTHYGIKYRSLQEPFIDTLHPFGELPAAFVAEIAELERGRICERVKAGLDRARSEGKQLGRPKVVFDRSKVLELHQQGKSYAQIASELGLSGKMTVYRAIRASQ